MWTQHTAGKTGDISENRMAHKGWREIFYHGNQLSHIQCHFYQKLNFFRKKKLEYVKQQKFLSCVICTKDWKRKFCRKNFYNITFKIACSANNNNFHFQEMCHQQGSVEISLELYPELIRWEWGPLQPKGNFAKVLSTPIQNIEISRRNPKIHFLCWFHFRNNSIFHQVGSIVATSLIHFANGGSLRSKNSQLSMQSWTLGGKFFAPPQWTRFSNWLF